MNKSVNTLRILAVDMINKANSGHPGAPLGIAPVTYTLFHDFLKITPKAKDWFDRDRFILASGHASSMLYALLHLAGYNVSMKDLMSFRQLGSITPGHPEITVTEGIDATSGPLGQGIAEACGMAIAETMLSKRFNKEDIKLIDHYTYCQCGDGDLQEGVTLEALQLISHLKLNKLIILYDSNKIQLDGPTSLATSLNVKAFAEALGFNYLNVKNPENLNSVKKAIEKAKSSDLPSIIECNTTIGYGSPLQGTSKSHGAPLGAANTEVLRENLNYHNAPFKVSKSVYEDYRSALVKNEDEYYKWEENLKKYQELYPEDYKEFKKVLDNDYSIPEGTFSDFEYIEEASRKTIGKAINKVSAIHKSLVAGSADLTCSTFVKGSDGDYTKDNHLGRNINYGVREHAMGAITNGLNLHHVKAMSGAFFVFSDYMKPAIRLAALMELPSIFIFTHDSVLVGEDGPTHEPIEQLAGLRAIPNLNVMRPSDSRTTVQALKYALSSKTTPSVIALTRQNLKVLDEVNLESFEKGAFIRKDFDSIDGVLVASGSEVGLALEVANAYQEKGKKIRVVEVISTYLFDKNSNEYKESLIPSDKPSIFVEMASSFGLKAYAKAVYGIDTFGLSGNANDVKKAFGFDKESLVKYCKKYF